ALDPGGGDDADPGLADLLVLPLRLAWPLPLEGPLPHPCSAVFCVYGKSAGGGDRRRGSAVPRLPGGSHPEVDAMDRFGWALGALGLGLGLTWGFGRGM